jgi:hypothetical protein
MCKVLEDASIDSGKPNTINALRMVVLPNLLKNPPQNAAATKAMVSLSPVVCNALKMSHDEPQASRAGTGQVNNLMNKKSLL